MGMFAYEACGVGGLLMVFLMILSAGLWCARLWVLLPPLSPPSLGGEPRVVRGCAACLVAAGSLIVCEESHGCADAPLTGESPLLRRISLSVSCWCWRVGG